MSFIEDYNIVTREEKAAPLDSNEYDAFINACNSQFNKFFVIDNIPASASSDGVKGQVAFDDNHIYICIQTNTWKRIALSTW